MYRLHGFLEKHLKAIFRFFAFFLSDENKSMEFLVNEFVSFTVNKFMVLVNKMLVKNADKRNSFDKRK